MGVRCDERLHVGVLEELPSQPSIFSQSCVIWLFELRGHYSVALLVEENNGSFHCQADLTSSRSAIPIQQPQRFAYSGRRIRIQDTPYRALLVLKWSGRSHQIDSPQKPQTNSIGKNS
ncbi:hypothetical protein H112_04340 [Trichophyton rubrum D6]|uniref:Uncharacterized protein n=3 Tax=Trichophyton TaxID=5550 RepID=F2SPW7_TRIRC|nr:uncharacterized protein TERG_04116 [Trichophyton rubrum CBS 118892]EZF22846.1 hypothetical protein H100_04348 [Trichophyton rubrum MR850]EZF41950.1 hypothetical protein H102_04332 [Trichophyton rubrum CBS 100081]EZF52606.1 hypothetical protein H103_04342 [Trichophyton rubrum CBS 288.86]EZF63303.1 hypothetical protein H104_04330 [Trichophyton rubrum CBS 289.86]EZF84519.1 hypothetical protein H110_04335 [Trichophyton rubrum MR1448]EZF95322.1 hypothetical protein H113_04375 [Trichophyton rubr